VARYLAGRRIALKNARQLLLKVTHILLEDTAKVSKTKATLTTMQHPKGHRVGCVRVSTLDQNGHRQLEGMELDKTFLDKASGKDVKRPQVTAMLDFVREGDSVFLSFVGSLGPKSGRPAKAGRSDDGARNIRSLPEGRP
jgi:hypothetical protein